jgi:primase-polymerase (primpol)-like protein
MFQTYLVVYDTIEAWLTAKQTRSISLRKVTNKNNKKKNEIIRKIFLFHKSRMSRSEADLILGNCNKFWYHCDRSVLSHEFGAQSWQLAKKWTQKKEEKSFLHEFRPFNSTHMMLSRCFVCCVYL